MSSVQSSESRAAAVGTAQPVCQRSHVGTTPEDRAVIRGEQRATFTVGQAVRVVAPGHKRRGDVGVVQQFREEYRTAPDGVTREYMGCVAVDFPDGQLRVMGQEDVEAVQTSEQIHYPAPQTAAQRLGYTAEDLAGMPRAMLECLCQQQGVRYPLGAGRAKLAALLLA